MKHSTLYLILFACIINTVFTRADAAPAETEIIIDLEQQEKINPFIFGHNALGHDSCTFSKDPACRNNGKYSNRGSGQWDPEKKLPDTTMVQLARQIKLNFLRFPGGCGVHRYKWKDTIGPLAARPMFQFGIDEFVSLCEKLAIEPVITLSYFTGSNQDQADLVEYLNTPLNADNPNGGINWAEIRAQNGHPEPYKVQYFEMGNEIYHGDHVDTGPPTGAEYAGRYIACRQMMKEIDPAIQLGAVLQGWNIGATSWDNEVASLLAKDMDFGIIHVYPIRYRSDSGKYSTKQIFRVALASPAQVGHEIETFSSQLKKLTNRDIPLAITEYNGHFRQEKPVPYRHSLGNALLIADLLRIFLTVDAPILGANYWQFANSYWGMLYNDSFMEKKGNSTKRPNFLVFELYAVHADNLLLATSVRGSRYESEALGGVLATGADKKHLADTPAGKLLTIPIAPSAWKTNKIKQLLSFSVPVKTTANKRSFMLTFSADNNSDYYHTYFTQAVNPDKRYRVTGKIKTETLTPGSSVYLAVQDSRGWKKTGWEKSTRKISGTTNWQDAVVEFQPEHDTKKITILIRRNRGAKTSGKVWLKDVYLQEIGPALRFPEATPYLSAVTSINKSGDKIDIIVINKNLEKPMTAQIIIKNGFNMAGTGRYRELNGASVDSTNENMQENVTIREGTFTTGPDSSSFLYEFSPHSVTALELYKK